MDPRDDETPIQSSDSEDGGDDPLFDPQAADSDDDGDEVTITEAEKPSFDEKDEDAYLEVAKLIEGGKLDKLKVDHCKLYLRKFGLRLTGKKAVLIDRIREHLEIKEGKGKEKYPKSTFTKNCKGDACMGDVVMFEQQVYDMFNIASRSSVGPSLGTRIVAGRIVKESYGKAKQQHTFTIEVLWSTGTKPLLPMQPLLIKGRNLYKLSTARQPWPDEAERQRILNEKHARGGLARQLRELRITDKQNGRPPHRKQPVAPIHNGPVRPVPFDNAPPPLAINRPMGNHMPPNPDQGILGQKPYQSRPYCQRPDAIDPSERWNPNQRRPFGPPLSHTRPPLMQNPNQPRTFGLPPSHARPPFVQNPNQPGPFGHKPNYPPNMKLECRFFRQGRCWYGSSCKFSHDKENASPPRSRP